MRLYDLGGGDQPQVASDRIMTVPNLLSFARLAVIPWLFVELASGTRGGIARALAIGFVFGATDWIDGYVARRFDQVTKLGKLLDPISDRVFIGAIVIGMAVAGLLPWWVVIAIVGRDVLMLVAGLALLGTGRSAPPVTRLGKTATFGLMWSFPFLLGAAIVATPAEPQTVLWGLGWTVLLVNLVLYYAAAVLYAVTVRRDGGTGDG